MMQELRARWTNEDVQLYCSVHSRARVSAEAEEKEKGERFVRKPWKCYERKEKRRDGVRMHYTKHSRVCWCFFWAISSTIVRLVRNRDYVIFVIGCWIEIDHVTFPVWNFNFIIYYSYRKKCQKKKINNLKYITVYTVICKISCWFINWL